MFERFAPVGVVAVIAFCGQARAVVPAELILRTGDEVAPGVFVTSLNSPFTNSAGDVGFSGFASAFQFVWIDGALALTTSSVVESAMGLSDVGDFAYKAAAGTHDSVHRASGLLQQEDDAAPDYPGRFISSLIRPSMTGDGTAYWVARIADQPGGTANGSVLYRANGSVVTKVVGSGDIVDGFTVSSSLSAISADFHVSDNNANVIVELTRSTGFSSRVGIAVNGSVVADQFQATGQGGSWQQFAGVSINNSGNYIFAGDTNSATDRDWFIAYNGSIAVREGSTVGGVMLAPGAETRALSINNLNEAVYIWGWGEDESLREHLFYSADAADLVMTSVRLLSIGDMVDLDGDSLADAIVNDFRAVSSSPGLDFADDGYVVVQVGLTDLVTRGNSDAIIRLQIPAPGAGAAAVLFAAAFGGVRRRR